MLTGNPSVDSLFSASRFRNGIQTAMRMGLPQAVEKRATFKWMSEKTFEVADTRNNPYDFSNVPTFEVARDELVASLTMPVAVEFFSTRTSSGDTAVGDFDVTKVKIILLDDEYVQIVDDNLGLPNIVTLDDSNYSFDFEQPPEALFDVTIHSVFFTARDES